jgi:hypothetical protein
MKACIFTTFGFIALGISLSGCSTIIDGTSQDIAISSTLPGARCIGERNGERILTIEQTPQTVSVRKTKDDILLTCNLDGYSDAAEFLDSGVATATYGNIILGGVVGWGIDSATGADNRYPDTINVQFVAPAPAVPVEEQTSELEPNS